jgi:hypothetical protein
MYAAPMTKPSKIDTMIIANTIPIDLPSVSCHAPAFSCQFQASLSCSLSVCPRAHGHAKLCILANIDNCGMLRVYIHQPRVRACPQSYCYRVAPKSPPEQAALPYEMVTVERMRT